MHLVCKGIRQTLVDWVLYRKLKRTPLEWKWMMCQDGDEVSVFYGAKFQGMELRMVINDFPAQPFYSLCIDGVVIGVWDGWPSKRWIRLDGPSMDVVKK